jgi:hypothetical protein
LFHTDLIVDPEKLAVVDGQLAARAQRWPSMSHGRLAASIDRIVARVDRDAVGRKRELVRDRSVEFWDDEGGINGVGRDAFTSSAKSCRT